MVEYPRPVAYYRVTTPLAAAKLGWLNVRLRLPADPATRRMVTLIGLVLLIGVLLLSLRNGRHVEGAGPSGTVAAEPEAVTATEAEQVQVSAGAPGLSTIFTKEVRHWEPDILRWATLYGVDPNLVGILMQIESCGLQDAASIAGAQGLFQVMPFHFTEGENPLDPETNARRGILYFAERLEQTNGDVGRAFAGYNGGPLAAAGNWDNWVSETQRYYIWATGLYRDITSGAVESPTLAKWLAAGGASLCRQAAERIELS